MNSGINHGIAGTERKLRVAIIHYWLVNIRGGEHVLREICHLFPGADIYTHVYSEKDVGTHFEGHKIRTTFVAKLPFAERLYQNYIGFMPRALEELDLSGYDLVISSESGPAKGVIVPPDTPHICYCHSPMRYVWDHYPIYRGRLKGPTRYIFSKVVHRLRQWDVTSAARVDRFVCNSSFTAKRVRKYYRRDADIVHPPVDLQSYSPSEQCNDAYLFVGQLVRYKRADLAVRAFRNTSRKLIVVGDGSERKELEKMASPNISFLGRVSNAQLAKLYAECKALIFPGEEDFGIVPLEAMASGRPVIAFGQGGVKDSVIDGQTGVLFNEQTEQSLLDAISAFEKNEMAFGKDELIAHAAKFSPKHFRDQFSSIVNHVMATNRIQTRDRFLGLENRPKAKDRSKNELSAPGRLSSLHLATPTQRSFA